jgi:sugar O-acyltransferase (sialic acid O-acetyltransferase NeuD family)
MSREIILVGGGGHCKSCIEVIEHEGRYKIFGILDKETMVGQKILDYEIKGTDALIEGFVKNGFAFLITIGQIKSAEPRKKIYTELTKLGADIATVISPRAHVSKYAKVGRGTIIMHNATVNAGASIGENNIVNTGSIIEHDVMVADHCHISTGAIINGNCRIGIGSFVGSSTTIINGVEIGERIIVGAGTIVTKNLSEYGIYSGKPVKKHANK